jgi:drug/metabolite transporter (DMT)-like permease
MNPPSKWGLFTLLGLGITAISFSAIFIKWSHAPAGVLGMNRLWLTEVLLLPWIWRVRGEFRSLTRRDWLWLIASGIFLGIHFWGWITSFQYTSVASSMILLNLSPLFTAVGATVFFKERLRPSASLGMVLALAGTGLVAGEDWRWGGGAWYGDLLSMIGAVAVAIHTLIGGRLRERISALVYSFTVFFLAALVLLFVNLGEGVPLFAYPLREWGIFILLSVVPTLFGHFLFNSLLRFVKPLTVQMAVLGEPVGAILLSAVFLGEPVTAQAFWGGVLSVGGIAWYMAVQLEKEPRQTEVAERKMPIGQK